jgi:ABC-type Fe3+-hydroxamate transport system substrate-binding protein
MYMGGDDTIRHEAPTRREYVKYSGAVVGGGLLAGCIGESGDGEPVDEGEESETGESYEVCMSPVGCHTFESVPESAAVFTPECADILVALDHGNVVNSLNDTEVYYTGYYDQLPGVSFDTSGLTSLLNDGEIDKEQFYELDSDVHHIDPVLYMVFDGDEADIEEIEENIGPWFANQFSRQNSVAADVEYGEDYEFYTMWELTEKFAQVYHREERAAALQEIQQELVETVESLLPPESERPSVGLVWWDGGEFTLYELLGPGFGEANYRPLEPMDAFEEIDTTAGTVDYETMLEIDPDVLVFAYGIDWTDSYNEFVESVPKHPVGSELTAVENDRLYQGGTRDQGPIFQIFQIEMAAKQIYPDVFGEWPGFDDDLTYEIPEDEQLFNRERVADIVNGDI